MNAQVYQLARQRRQSGDTAPWYVAWREAGRRHSRHCGAGAQGKRLANAIKARIDAGEGGAEAPAPCHIVNAPHGSADAG
jgi:hypothetical protein